MKRCCVCEKKVDHLPGCGKCNECCARTCEERQPEYQRRVARRALRLAMKEAAAAGVSELSVRNLVQEVWDLAVIGGKE